MWITTYCAIQLPVSISSIFNGHAYGHDTPAKSTKNKEIGLIQKHRLEVLHTSFPIGGLFHVLDVSVYLKKWWRSCSWI